MNASQLRARYRRIVFFFGRVTLGFIFWEIVLRRLGLGRLADRTRDERNRRTTRRFRDLAVSMGGLMIKVGQFLSARLDILPPEITAELADLQDAVPAEDPRAIRALAERELGASLESHFAWFEDAPLAAASLGQAHRARLRDDDAAELGFTDVVVKVQRPDIEAIVDVDLAALRRVAGWLARYKPVSSRADVPALVEEFAATTRAEIDYLAEGSNAETFSAAFSGDLRVHVPRVAWELTTRRVLTLEDVTAIKITDHAALREAGIDPSAVAHVLVDTYLQQIFDDGFFHADPHPGNLFVTPLDGFDERGGRRFRLTFIDFGMVGIVPENLREGLGELLIAIGTRDGERLVAGFRRLGVLLPSADIKLIEAASMQAFERFGGMSMSDLKGIDHSEMMGFGLQFESLMRSLPFQLPENLLLLGRTVAILSGMCTALDPDFSIWTELGPYAERLISGEGGSTFDTIIAEGGKLLQTAIALPRKAERVLTQIERGELAVRTPLLDLRVRRLERAVGRVALAIVFAALLIAGALLHASDPRAGTTLMWIAALPGLGVLMGGRGRHPGSR